MFDIVLDNSLEWCWIIFESVEDYVAEGKTLFLRRMSVSLKHYNLLF